MKRISSKALHTLCTGCLSLVIASCPSLEGTITVSELDSVSSSYSINTLSTNNRETTDDLQLSQLIWTICKLAIGTGVVFRSVLLFFNASRNNPDYRGKNTVSSARLEKTLPEKIGKCF